MTPSLAGPATAYIFLEFLQKNFRILQCLRVNLIRARLSRETFRYPNLHVTIFYRVIYTPLSSTYYLGTYIYFLGKRVINLPHLNNIASNLYSRIVNYNILTITYNTQQEGPSEQFSRCLQNQKGRKTLDYILLATSTRI